ncbi:hypothetical protein OIDMADRAFT_61287 [Oidiodendron maius Zn]|uniref:Uncharacterized protein n=1 Tax=Oidiodendron maius (strain Zn) TaxID=913774 RepID=A0A0C3CVD3_OIDMZ|nr:hypothetical protein OIDMADRAFT_61287 [Oidiodendron maius Zn]
MTLVQGPVLFGAVETRWLREAARKFPKLSTLKYAETELGPDGSRELEPMSSFNPLAQQILVELEMGWGFWDKHFRALVVATFGFQDHYNMRELRGKLIDHSYMGKWGKIFRRLDMRSLQLLSLEPLYMDSRSPALDRAFVTFLERAPNLRSPQLSLWDYLYGSPTNLSPTRIFDYHL